MKQMSNALPKWLDYHSSKVTPSLAMLKKKMACNPVLNFLMCLAGMDAPQQQSLTSKQLFGKDNENVNWRFEAFWAAQGRLGKDRPAAQAVFVAEEFSKLSQEEQAKWTVLVEKAVQEVKKGKDGCLEAPSLLPPKDAQRVFDMLHSTMGPLIEDLSIMLGCHVMLAVFGPEP
ncbi:hypothetical protein ARMSODRAFT_1023769 [Armillaria solidipes]|uniref:Uncharacterized protein n=1 Tax=Armillaria solidipes TaxID=1076256 RepID=A0A2H3B1H1_9AGAR|nr:hypothetical protein ARMSODRAFT_1023769 [Armillaria solidipes]